MYLTIIYIIRSKLQYQYEEPQYNFDTEPRFFKKTFETLSGFLTHTFSKDDVKVKEEKPTGKLLKNPLESVRPVKFPAAQVHNYQEVPHQSYHKTKQKSNNGNVHVTTSHLLGSNQQTKSVSGASNSWKPSQR